MSPLSDVLSHLSDEINMQEDLSHEMCSHRVPIYQSPHYGGGGGGGGRLYRYLLALEGPPNDSSSILKGKHRPVFSQF